MMCRYLDCILFSSKAVQLIKFDSHAHLNCKAGSVIGGKSHHLFSDGAVVNTYCVHNRRRFVCDYKYDMS